MLFSALNGKWANWPPGFTISILNIFFLVSTVVVSHKTSNRNSNDLDVETLSIQSDFTCKMYDVGSPDTSSSKHACSKGFCLLAHSSMNGCKLFANSALFISIAPQVLSDNSGVLPSPNAGCLGALLLCPVSVFCFIPIMLFSAMNGKWANWLPGFISSMVNIFSLVSTTVVSHKTSNRNSNDSDDETLSIQSDFTSKKYDVGSPDINSSKHAFSKGFCLLAHSSMNGCSLFANSALSILITHIVRQ